MSMNGGIVLLDGRYIVPSVNAVISLNEWSTSFIIKTARSKASKSTCINYKNAFSSHDLMGQIHRNESISSYKVFFLAASTLKTDFS